MKRGNSGIRGQMETEDATLLALEMEEAMSQGMQAACQNWKREGRRFSLEPQEGA